MADTDLDQHFRKMQEACASYLSPAPYRERTDPGRVVEGSGPTRDAAFIRDMIYMLDGPEQRAAQAARPHEPAPDSEVEAVKAAMQKCIDNERPGDEDRALDLLARAAIAAYEQARPAGEPVAWMYHFPGDLEHGWQRFQTYEGMSCNDEDAGMIETPLYATPQPAPVTGGELIEQIIASLEAEQKRLDEEDYLMDTSDCIDTIREKFAALTFPTAPAEDERAKLPARNDAISEVVGLCNRIPGSTQWNAAEFMYDLLARAIQRGDHLSTKVVG